MIPLQAHPRARPHGEAGPTLDVVAQLFDHFARDATLPPAVRDEILRLRVPALRATQSAPDFLVNRAHPARRMVDAIGAAALGVDPGASETDATVAAIAAAVHTVLNDFDSELEPFAAAATFLEDFVVERGRGEDAAARPMVQAIVRRETAELPRRAAQEEVARRLRSRLWIPAPVRAMLMGAWVDVLAAAYRVHGDGSPEWHGALRTMDDLLWSVEPKASAEGRRRLAAILPGLVDALSLGLARAEVPGAARDEFLSVLVDCHAQAMRAGLRGLMLVQDKEASTAPVAPAFVTETFDAGPRRVERTGLAAAADGEVDYADDRVLRLRIGAWIEIERGARVPARKRLAWLSPLTGVFLFVGLAPESIGVAFTPEALAEKFRRREVRPLDPTPLVERTLASLVVRLSPQG